MSLVKKRFVKLIISNKLKVADIMTPDESIVIRRPWLESIMGMVFDEVWIPLELARSIIHDELKIMALRNSAVIKFSVEASCP